MSTVKKRVNVSVSESLNRTLEYLAQRDQVPQATKAAELLRIAVEVEEDQVWDKLASRRDMKNAKFISHQKAWD